MPICWLSLKITNLNLLDNQEWQPIDNRRQKSATAFSAEQTRQEKDLARERKRPRGLNPNLENDPKFCLKASGDEIFRILNCEIAQKSFASFLLLNYSFFHLGPFSWKLSRHDFFFYQSLRSDEARLNSRISKSARGEKKSQLWTQMTWDQN